MAEKYIIIKGARQHNLKNIDIKIPRDKLVVITGLSGSGKSSLAFDTIYAEGQRRYVESLSAYARQFLELMEKPDVDMIEGLSPSIAIEQKALSKNPRSTVATITEIYDYLRLLFARLGQPFCPKCNIPISGMSASQMVDEVLNLPDGTKFVVAAPIARGNKGEFKRELELFRKQGFLRAYIDGELKELSDTTIELNKYIKHDIDIVVDRLVKKDGIKDRLTDSIEMALKIGKGMIAIHVIDGEVFLFNQNFACTSCGFTFQEVSPRLFSFNNPHGACPTCDGLGTKRFFSPELLVTNEELPLKDGAIRALVQRDGTIKFMHDFYVIAKHFGVSQKTPFKNLPEKMKEFIFYGRAAYTDSRLEKEVPTFNGIIRWLEESYRSLYYSSYRDMFEEYLVYGVCPTCNGKRLKKESLAIKINGKNISDITAMDIGRAYDFFQELSFTGNKAVIATRILKEIRERLGFLLEVGLSYLTLDRSAMTLSGGESQRINLATQIGSKLAGVLYVLDEPSIGLHPRDNNKLIKTLKSLRDIGNSVIVVEHDKDTILSADWVIDLGPHAGERGGEVMAEGTPQQIIENPKSLTGLYLSGKKFVELPERRRKPFFEFLTLEGASENNLKNVTVKFPLRTFTCVTGVSGSGKSTLVIDTLYRAIAKKFYRSTERPGKFKNLTGIHYIDKIIDVDQSPIGKTPRSNPATYIGFFTLIRELFAMLPESKLRGYTASRFSFNVSGGRCEACNGEGYVKVEMHFMADIYVLCEQCGGKRYNRETLEIRYKGKNISEVLDMTVKEASHFFENVPNLSRILDIVDEVGLGYIRLGQSATTLSGGEAQRIKLAKELTKKDTGRTLYILDEPTTGLHFDDVKKLLKVLQKLVDMGNTVIVIEHNLDVIKSADWIIDLGPEGGEKGGYIVAEGTPEDIANNPNSVTGEFLKELLKR